MPSVQVGKNRQSTFTRLAFPTLPSLKLQPVRATLTEERWHHDVLMLQFSGNLPAWITTLKTGVPVMFSFTQGAYSRDWSGYVSNIQTHTASQAQEIMEVYCVGTTYVLKDRVPRVFENQSIVSIVKAIVEEFDFKFVGEDNGVVFDQVSLAGHSYWEWIVEQAKKIGYGMYVDGMTFYFRPMDKIINAGVTSLPTFVMQARATGMGNLQDDRTLDWMRTTHGEHIETTGATRAVKTVGGVNPMMSTKLSSSSDPKSLGTPVRKYVSDTLFSQVNQEHVANYPETAAALAEGYAQSARFNVPAKLKGQGDPRIRVMNPVVVAGTSDNSDGIWVVNKVMHGFTSNHNYQVEMDIATDGSGETSKQYYNTAQNKVVGVVNLEDALNNGGRNPNAIASNSRSLKLHAAPLTELDQGWNRTPAKWRYSKQGRR